MENNNNDIAVIGVSCLMSGANSLEELHQVLSEGRDMVRDIGKERIYHSCLTTRNPYQVNGHLGRVDIFDYPFFNIARKEAEAMDPNQRLVLELTVTAIENSGYPVSFFKGKEVAVYLAAKAHSTYYDFLEDKDYNAFLGNLQTMLAGRVAHKLDLRGPAITLDTACSSSLIAVHEAISKLLLKEVDYAIAGGINIESDFFELKDYSAGGLGIHSMEGRSRPFDDSADGIGGGEGGGIIFLKRFRDALSDGDAIHAVIKGSAINQDGHSSNGITAPSPDAQTKVLTTAWNRAKIAPETITYVEAHGTGTKLGDPIEFSALNEAFRKFTSKVGFCAISALKSNYGHLNNAAGIAGLLKAIASLKYRSIYPTLHFSNLNEHIDAEDAAIYVCDTFKPWEAESPRRCGVSSFGLSGTNVHMVLEESNAQIEPSPSKIPPLVKVSAKSRKVLVNYLQVLRDTVPAEPVLSGFLSTFNQGRDDYAFRTAFYAEDGIRLKEKITDYLNRLDDEALAPTITRMAVLLLANDCPTDAEVIKTYLAYSSFRETYEDVLNSGEKTPQLEVLAFHLASMALFKNFDIEISVVVGFGIGKLAKSIIVDDVPLMEALNSLNGHETELKEENRAKLKKAVRSIQEDQKVAFIELSSTCLLSSCIGNKVIEEKICGSFTIEDLICEMYLHGIQINWAKYYKQLPNVVSKCEVPTYPFERIPCSSKNALSHFTKMVKKWHHQLIWKEQPISDKSNIKKPEGKYLWIRIGNTSQELKSSDSDNYLLIQHSTGETQGNENFFTADLTNKPSIAQLRDDIESSRIIYHGIVFDASVKYEAPTTKEAEMKVLQMLFNVAMIFQSNLYRSNFLFSVVTGSQDVTLRNNLELMRTFDAMLSTFLKSLLVDFPKARMLSIDFKNGIDRKNLIELVQQEIMTDNHQYFIRYEGGKRFVQKLKQDEEIKEVSVLDSSKYLITGGSGGIGLEMACMLSMQPNTKEIILVGRSDLAFLLEGQDRSALNRREQQIHEKFTYITGKGVKLRYISADITKRKKLTAKLQDIDQLDVLIHCAGLNYQSKILADKDWEDVTACLAPKVDGTINLVELGKSIKVGKLIFFSSLNAIVPKPNSLEYAISNAFLDAYASQLKEQGMQVTSINWPGWRGVGMGGERLINDPDALQDIHVIEGFASLAMAIYADHPNTIVANFNKRELGQNPFFLLDLMEEDHQEISAIETPDISDNGKPIASIIEDIWCEVLKMDSIGHDVDFFEIGGHSLNGTQVLNRVGERLGVELELEDLFEYGDIGSLSDFVEKRMEELKENMI